MNNNNLPNDFNQLLNNTMFNPAYKRKKMVHWAIRTTILAVLYIVFWQYTWVRWSLWIVAPLSILSLAVILLVPYILKRKIQKVSAKMEGFYTKKSR